MKKRRDSGEVVIEATIVVTVVMVFVTAMLYLGMILYQQTAVSVMATQTASSIAELYSNNGKDPFTGYIGEESVFQQTTYSTAKTEEYIETLEKKADVFARYRLKSSRILSTGAPSVTINLVKKEGDFFTDQIVVTVEDSYVLPLAAFFGSEGKFKFKSTARADCVDIIEYVSGVEAVGDPENSNVSVLPGLATCTVTFIPDRNRPDWKRTVVSVVRDSSILGSAKYTNSVMPKNPTNGDFEFYGWTDSNGREFNASTIVNDNTVVYGNWKCTVTLKANGGTVNSRTTYSFKTPLNSRPFIPTPVREGYSFDGWYSNGTLYVSNDSVITGNVTLTAKWTRIKYTVTLEANGGTLPPGKKVNVVGYNESMTLPAVKRQGFVIKGWYDQAGKFYGDLSSFTVTQNITLTAHWEGCVIHRSGHCGVDHECNITYSWHRSGLTTVMQRCIVCVDCGGFIKYNYDKYGHVIESKTEIIDYDWGHWCSYHLSGGKKYKDDHLWSEENIKKVRYVH